MVKQALGHPRKTHITVTKKSRICNVIIYFYLLRKRRQIVTFLLKISFLDGVNIHVCMLIRLLGFLNTDDYIISKNCLHGI